MPEIMVYCSACGRYTDTSFHNDNARCVSCKNDKEVKVHGKPFDLMADEDESVGDAPLAGVLYPFWD